MPDAAPSPAARRSSTGPQFQRILCGVNGGRPARHAVDQSLALAAAGGAVHFVAVCDAAGVGPNERATLGVHRAREALQIAHEQARDAGVEATTDLVYDDQPSRKLLELAADHDLLIIGSHGQSRASGIAVGGTAPLAAHRATVPVLVARARDRDAAFPGAVVAATDARDAGRRVVETAARLAGDAPLLLVHGAAHDGGPEHHELGAEAAAAMEITGRDPVVVCEPRRPVDLILDVADDESAGLVVIGSSGRTGLRALGSVSERVCARARCSVLVLRPGAANGT